MKEANPKLIGVFVIGGLSLLIAALVLFSSQDLFVTKRFFVSYFQQSVNGLHVGAAVRFRGIPVGQVLEIDGVYNPQTGRMIPRLTMEFHPEVLENAVVSEGEYSLLPFLLESGLRASLKSASLLTGQLYVSLDFRPGIPERYLGTGDDEYPEMPTVDSGFDKALEKISEIPVHELVANLSSAASAAEDLLRNPHINESLAALPGLLTEADATVVGVRRFISSDLTEATGEASETLVVARTSIQALAETINKDTLVKLDSTLVELESTLQLAHKHLESNDPLMHELLSALHEISNAARSIRSLADALEEHPEALIRGKQSQ
jgi:phospholipid/cholesterol/gamma-HCH transport system substrate-binding protein